MDLTLDPVEVRVLGSLIEKEITTPEYYPLTLNALVNACNQKSNREPVVSYDEQTVEDALESLRSKGLAAVRTGVGLRVPKYLHRISETLNLGRRELALLCVLMLRGPQTLGELRDRTERMHSFGDLEEVGSRLDYLMQFDPSLATRLPRLPGTKEPRYAHLLSGPVEMAQPEAAPAPAPSFALSGRVAALEQTVGELREEIAELRREIADFRAQFD